MTDACQHSICKQRIAKRFSWQAAADFLPRSAQSEAQDTKSVKLLEYQRLRASVFRVLLGA
jgi:hypothetical protein